MSNGKKKFALRDFHNAIVQIYEVPENLDLSFYSRIDDLTNARGEFESISSEDYDIIGEELYSKVDLHFLRSYCTEENIHRMNRKELVGYYDGYWNF